MILKVTIIKMTNTCYDYIYTCYFYVIKLEFRYYIFVNIQNTLQHQPYIIIVLRDKFQFIRFGAHFSLSFQNVTQISLYSIILQFAMSGFAITTFFQLLDLIIKAIIIAFFVIQLRSTIMLRILQHFMKFENAHIVQARLFATISAVKNYLCKFV